MFSLSDELISGITRTQDWEGLHLLGLVTLIHLHSSHTLGKKKLSEDAHHHDKGLLAEIWSNKIRQKTASGAYAGLGKMIFRHMSTHVIWSQSRKDHVSLQYDDTAVTHIMWFLATTSRKSWTRTFFSINVLLFLSARMFLKLEVRDFLWEANSFLNRAWHMARNLRQVHDLTLTRVRESTVVADFADFADVDMHAPPAFMFMGSQEKEISSFSSRK